MTKSRSSQQTASFTIIKVDNMYHLLFWSSYYLITFPILTLLY